MPVFPQARDQELPGDTLSRKSVRAFLYGVFFIPATIAGYIWLPQIWNPIMHMEGASFFLSSTLLGGVMAAFPVLGVAMMLLSLWWAVEARFSPRQTPKGHDKLVIGLGLLVSYGPAIGFAITVIHALMVGKVHFSNPPRDYLRATDPQAYWEGLGFMVMAGSVLGFMVTRYWQAKLGKKTAE